MHQISSLYVQFCNNNDGLTFRWFIQPYRWSYKWNGISAKFRRCNFLHSGAECSLWWQSEKFRYLRLGFWLGSLSKCWDPPEHRYVVSILKLSHVFFWKLSRSWDISHYGRCTTTLTLCSTIFFSLLLELDSQIVVSQFSVVSCMSRLWKLSIVSHFPRKKMVSLCTNKKTILFLVCFSSFLTESSESIFTNYMIQRRQYPVPSPLQSGRLRMNALKLHCANTTEQG